MAYSQGKYAWTAKVGEKGQIVIPKEARQLLNIKPGDTIILLGDDERGVAIPHQGKFQQLTDTLFNEKGENK